MHDINHKLTCAAVALIVVSLAILVHDLFVECRRRQRGGTSSGMSQTRTNADRLMCIALAFLAWGPMLLVLSVVRSVWTQSPR
jgi:hypothetical protein